MKKILIILLANFLFLFYAEKTSAQYKKPSIKQYNIQKPKTQPLPPPPQKSYPPMPPAPVKFKSIPIPQTIPEDKIILDEEVEQSSDSESLETANGQKKSDGYSWEEVFQFKIIDNLNAAAYLNNEQDIKNVEFEIKDLIASDPNSKPKSTFETTQEYELRKRSIDEKKLDLESKKLSPLLTKRNEYQDFFVDEKKIQTNINLRLENYNADRSRWEIDLQDPLSKINYKLYLTISPKTAEQLWRLKDSISIFQSRRIKNDEPNYYHLLLEEQGRVLFSALLNRGLEFSKTDYATHIFSSSELEIQPNSIDGSYQKAVQLLSKDTTFSQKLPPGRYSINIEFIVNSNGSVSDVKVYSSDIGFEFGGNFYKAILNSKWSPGIKNSTKVNTMMKNVLSILVQE